MTLQRLAPWAPFIAAAAVGVPAVVGALTFAAAVHYLTKPRQQEDL